MPSQEEGNVLDANGVVAEAICEESHGASGKATALQKSIASDVEPEKGSAVVPESAGRNALEV